MNRRSFFRRLATLVAGATVAPVFPLDMMSDAERFASLAGTSFIRRKLQEEGFARKILAVETIGVTIANVEGIKKVDFV